MVASLLDVKGNKEIKKKYIFLTQIRSHYIYIHIRECGSTLYVRLADTAPPTNTNFLIIFLLTRLLEGLYEDLPAHKPAVQLMQIQEVQPQSTFHRTIFNHEVTRATVTKSFQMTSGNTSITGPRKSLRHQTYTVRK